MEGNTVANRMTDQMHENEIWNLNQKQPPGNIFKEQPAVRKPGDLRTDYMINFATEASKGTSTDQLLTLFNPFQRYNVGWMVIRGILYDMWTVGASGSNLAFDSAKAQVRKDYENTSSGSEKIVLGGTLGLVYVGDAFAHVSIESSQMFALGGFGSTVPRVARVANTFAKSSAFRPAVGTLSLGLGGYKIKTMIDDPNSTSSRDFLDLGFLASGAKYGFGRPDRIYNGTFTGLGDRIFTSDRRSLQELADSLRKLPADYRPTAVARLYGKIGEFFGGSMKKTWIGNVKFHEVLKTEIQSLLNSGSSWDVAQLGQYGKCAEIDAINTALHAYELRTGTKIRTLEDIRAVLKGSRIQTAEVRGLDSISRHGAPKTPCPLCDPLLKHFGVEYVAPQSFTQPTITVFPQTSNTGIQDD